MRVLTGTDQLFFLLENRNQPMHVGGLFLFELPDSAPDNFVSELVRDMRENKTQPTFPFDQVLHHRLFWKRDADFDVSHHFRHIALPKPAGMTELLDYISKEHSNLMDQSKPLWEWHIVEGINENRFAMYLKLHHSLMDGIAVINLIKKIFAHSPSEKSTLPLWSLMTKNRHNLDNLIPKNKSFLKIIKEQSLAIPPVAKELFKNAYERLDKDYISITQAPESILNQAISSSRKVNVISFDKADFIQIAKTFDVTFNDAVLAVCSGALRRYLQDLDALPKKPLIGFVPLSLRKNDNMSNQITFILANMATHITDPVARLRAINGSTMNAKNRFSRMSSASAIIYSGIAYGRIGLQVLTGLFPEYRGFNLIISNVPEIKPVLYWHGAKLVSIYPASIVVNDQAMNITLCTYNEKVEICMVVCSKILPDSEKVLQYMQDELAVFREMINH